MMNLNLCYVLNSSLFRIQYNSSVLDQLHDISKFRYKACLCYEHQVEFKQWRNQVRARALNKRVESPVSKCSGGSWRLRAARAGELFGGRRAEREPRRASRRPPHAPVQWAPSWGAPRDSSRRATCTARRSRVVRSFEPPPPSCAPKNNNMKRLKYVIVSCCFWSTRECNTAAVPRFCWLRPARGQLIVSIAHESTRTNCEASSEPTGYIGADSATGLQNNTHSYSSKHNITLNTGGICTILY